jgi:hypothetical protein
VTADRQYCYESAFNINVLDAAKNTPLNLAMLSDSTDTTTMLVKHILSYSVQGELKFNVF